MWWWYLIPILVLSAVALMSYISGEELKEDIRKDRLADSMKGVIKTLN